MTTSTLHDGLQAKLTETFEASLVTIEDYSHLHAGHAQNTGHHLKITIVSPQFEGKNGLERHRMAHAALKVEMQSLIHALELVLKSPSET
ncbi:MAG: BolA family transcriptional regulator [Vampirovibrionales bacterium]|nr:BolA family transcriptional regulator [Vampirovibrionales bacterium]